MSHRLSLLAMVLALSLLCGCGGQSTLPGPAAPQARRGDARLEDGHRVPAGHELAANRVVDPRQEVGLPHVAHPPHVEPPGG